MSSVSARDGSKRHLDPLALLLRLALLPAGLRVTVDRLARRELRPRPTDDAFAPDSGSGTAVPGARRAAGRARPRARADGRRPTERRRSGRARCPGSAAQRQAREHDRDPDQHADHAHAERPSRGCRATPTAAPRRPSCAGRTGRRRRRRRPGDRLRRSVRATPPRPRSAAASVVPHDWQNVRLDGLAIPQAADSGPRSVPSVVVRARAGAGRAPGAGRRTARPMRPRGRLPGGGRRVDVRRCPRRSRRPPAAPPTRGTRRTSRRTGRRGCW